MRFDLVDVQAIPRWGVHGKAEKNWKAKIQKIQRWVVMLLDLWYQMLYTLKPEPPP